MAEIFACVGDNCIDRFLPPADECLVGGNAVNVAVQLSQLGRSAHYLGAVGDDPGGAAVRQALIARGVNVERLLAVPGQRTAFTGIEMTEDGDRSFVFEEFGACAGYRPREQDVAFLRTTRHVHIGWLDDGGDLKSELRGSGVTLSQDLSVNSAPGNLGPGGLDIAFCSAEWGRAEAEADRVLSSGAKLAVITLGAEGSFASDGRRAFRQTALPIAAEDTTGAGDAFIAGFLDFWVAGQDLPQCMVRGTERAALACLHRGGFPQDALKGLALTSQEL